MLKLSNKQTNHKQTGQKTVCPRNRYRGHKSIAYFYLKNVIFKAIKQSNMQYIAEMNHSNETCFLLWILQYKEFPMI